ncbi:hypothetical protein L4A40_28630 [Bacillus cereus]|uniref:competence protein CoiA family protein n=1 Tax=Bacillus cereus TaxID=1396 RepID=UPI001F0F44D5|nr:competence protein CoiA family protein [Bacillus cereus]MCH5477037.1 hypothetical protein [Bacillus cereus]
MRIDYIKILNIDAPHCNEDVIFKKGNKRGHHFSHKSGSDCTISRETLLHFEAKHFLVNKINKEEDIKLKIDLSYFKKKYKEFLRAINIDSYEISLLEMLKFYKTRFAKEFQDQQEEFLQSKAILNLRRNLCRFLPNEVL